MDPLTAIVAAISAGALAALKDGANDAVTRAYQSVRDFFTGHSTEGDLEDLEKKPQSEARRAVFAEELGAAGLGEDEELLARALALAEVLRQHDPESIRAVGVDLTDVQVDNIRIGRIVSEGTGFKAERVAASGDITIDDVQAGKPDDPN